jgi:hypothetical protein
MKDLLLKYLEIAYVTTMLFFTLPIPFIGLYALVISILRYCYVKGIPLASKTKEIVVAIFLQIVLSATFIWILNTVCPQ